MNNGDLYFDGKKYISSKRAAEMSGYSADYIGQLARAGKLDARVVGRSWFVSEDSLQSHKSIATNALKLNAQKFASQNNKFISKSEQQKESVQAVVEPAAHKIEINRAAVQAPSVPAAIKEVKVEKGAGKIYYPSLDRTESGQVATSSKRDIASESRISPFLPPLKKDRSIASSSVRPRIELKKVAEESEDVSVPETFNDRGISEKEFFTKAATFVLSMLLVFGLYLGTMNAEVRSAIANGARITSGLIKHPAVALKSFVGEKYAEVSSFVRSSAEDRDPAKAGTSFDAFKAPWKGVAATFGGMFDRDEDAVAQAGESGSLKKASDAFFQAITSPFKKASSFLSSLFDVEVKVSDYYVTNAPASENTATSVNQPPTQQTAQNTAISTSRDSEITGIYNQNYYYTNSGVGAGELDSRLDSLRTYLESEIASISRVTYINNESRIRNFENLDLDDFENIDIDSSTISNSTITGGTITNSTITTTATTTTGGLAITSLDCSALGNGGKLTTDADGNVVCDDDQGGGGGGDLDDLGDVDVTGAPYGSLLSFDGTNWIDIATSSLAISWNDIADIPAGFADGTDDGTASALFGESFAIDSNGYLAPTTTISIRMPLGFVSQASSTIAGNLTVTGTSLIPYASSTAVTVSGGLYIGTLNGPLQANNGFVSATTSIGVLYGGTGLVTPPTYGQILVGNSSGGYTLTATSSLGINSAIWGSITGTLSDQTDLQNALDAKLSLSAWYATTTDALDEGSSNLYYTLARFASALAGTTTDALDEGIANLYFTNARADARINATSTIGTLTSAPNLSITESQISDLQAYLLQSDYYGTTTHANISSLPNLSILQSQISDLALFGKSWEISNGALSPTTTLGIGVYASSTIGNGTQAGGLTIYGGATTTGNAYFAGNVGIGGINSSYLLTVGPSGSTQTNVRVNGNGYATQSWQSTLFDSSGISGGSSVTLRSGASGNITLETGSSAERVRILGSNGNVGIGTTSPYAKLSVAGDAVFGSITATTSTSTLAGLDLTTGGLQIATLPSVLLKTDSSGNVVAAVAGTDYASVSQTFGKAWEVAGNGYLAPTTTRGIIVNASSTIGNGTQAGGLTISGGATTTGNAYIAGNTNVIGLFEASSHVTLNSGSAAVRFRGGNSVVNSPSDGVFEFGGGSFDPDGTILTSTLGLGTTSPYSKLSIHALNGETNSALFSIASSTASATTTHFVVTNAGKVGIGTANPTNNLEVMSGTGGVKIGNSSNSSVIGFFNGGTEIGFMGWDSSSSRMEFSSDDNLGVDIDANNNSTGRAFTVTMHNFATELFRVGDDGNVGIGTTSPYARLSVAGDAVFGSVTATTSTSTLAGLNVATGGLRIATLPSVLLKTDSSGNVVAAVAGTDYASVSQTFGKSWEIANGALSPTTTLGIGVYASSTIGNGTQAGGLTINGGATTTGNLYLGGSLKIGTTSTDSGFVIHAAGSPSNGESFGARFDSTNLNSYANNEFSIRGANKGYVGVGGTSVTGGPAFDGRLYFESYTASGISLVAGTGVSNNDIRFYTNGAASGNERVRITNAGNLGVGTSSPYAKLSVAGQTVAEYFTATSSTASTFPYASTTALTVAGTFWGANLTECISTNKLTWSNGQFGCDIDLQAAGGSGSGGTWSTTTSQVAGQLINYSNTSSDIIAIGGSGTTTAEYWFDPNSTTAKLTGAVDVTGALTADSLVLANALGIASGGTGLTSTGASSTVLVSNGSSLAYQLLSPGNFTTSNISQWTNDAGYITASSLFGKSWEVDANGNLAPTTTIDVYLPGNLGIGTTSPYAKLSVVGEVVATNFTATSTNATSTFAGGLNVGSGGLVYDSSSGVTSISSVEIGNLSFDTDAGIVTWADLPVVNATAGTVESYIANIDGIPLLTLYSTADGSGSVSNMRAAVGTTTPYSRFSVWGTGTGSGQLFSLVNNASTTVFQALDNGNIGIGTTSPYARLSVAGDAVFGSVTATTSTSTLAGLSISSGGLTIGTLPSVLLKTDSSGNVVAAVAGTDYASVSQTFGKSWEIANGALSPTTTLGIGVYASSTIGNGTQAGGLTINGGATTTGNLYVAGSIAINDSNPNPGYALDIGNGGSINIDNGSYLLWSNGDGSIRHTGTALELAAAGALRQVITSTGVGIGTSSPYSKLSVWGSGTGTNRLFELTNSASTTLGFVQENGTVYFQGNVGIGTTSPYAKLSVAGEVVANNFTATSTTATSTFAGGLNVGSGGLVYDSSSGVTSISSVEIGNLSFDTDAGLVSWADLPVVNAPLGMIESYIAHIDGIPLLTLYSTADGSGSVSNMRVAVGTTTPYSRLSVWGTGTGTGSTFELVNSASTTLARFLDNGTGYFLGNIGIGTTSPYAKLSVAGDAVFGSITATTSTSTLAGLNVATGGLRIATLPSVLLKTDASGNIVPAVAGGDYVSGGRDWNVVSGALSPTTTIGIGVYASSTIGNGTQAGGLTIAGGATTTGNAYVAGNLEVGLGNLNVSDGALFVEGLNNGYVGIGTSTPSEELVISNLWGGSADTRIQFENSNASSLFGVGLTSDDYFVFDSNIGNLLSINTLNGNVGIGTTSPYAKLSVGGQVVANSYLSTTTTGFRNIVNQSGTPSQEGLILQNIAGNNPQASLVLNGSAPDIFEIWGGTGGSTLSRFAIDLSSGNIGIGTTSPYAKLSVVGPVVAEYFHATSTSATSTIAGGLSVGNGALQYDWSSGETSIDNLLLGATSFETDAGIVTWMDLPVSSSAASGVKQSYTAQIDGVPLLTIYSEADGVGSTRAQRVGIGTTTPYARFTIWGTSTADNLLDVVGNASSTLLTVTSSGNVGIGTSSPYARLSVAGAIVAGNFTATTSTSTLAGLRLSNPSLANCNTIDTDANGNLICGTDASGGGSFGQAWEISNGALSPTTTLGIGVYASSTIGNGTQSGGLTISGGATTTGNAYFAGTIGIGTSSPSTVLHITGSNALLTLTSNSSTLGPEMFFDATGVTNGHTYSIYSGGSDNTAGAGKFSIYDGTAESDRFVIDGNGNVGIGTSSPYSKLSVWGSGTGTNRLFELTNSASTTLASVLENGTVYFQGNVGIGTTSPYAKLSVAGEVVANNFTATSTSATSTFAGGLNVGSGGLVYDYSSGITSISALETGNINFADDAGVVSWVNLPVTSAASGVVQSYTAFLDENPALTVYGTSNGSGGVNMYNIGIGTSTPYAKLSVWGTDTSANTRLLSLANSASTTVFAVNNAGGFFALASSTVGDGTQAGGLTVSGGATTTGNAYVAGVVGIGRSPNATLPLSLNAIGSDQGISIYESDGGNQAVTIGADTASGRITLKTSNSTVINLSARSDTSSFINSGANFGIGTTSPWAKLSVNAAGGVPSFAIGSSTTQFIVDKDGKVGIGGFSNEDYALNISSTNYNALNIQSSSVDGYTDIHYTGTGRTFASGVGNDSETLFGLANKFFIFDLTSQAHRLIVDTNGNIGIGTTSPYAKLSVVGGVVADNFIATSTTATSTFAGGLNVGNGGLVYDVSANVTSVANLALGAMSFDTDAGQVSWVDMPVTSSATAGTIESYSAQIDGTPILTVYSESNGSGGIQNARIGIGTTTPYAQLSVAGDAVFGTVTATTSTSTFAGIHIASGNLRVSSLVSCDTIDTDANGNFICGTDASGGGSFGQAWEIDANGNLAPTSTINVYLPGNLGIGTTSPYAKLSVVGPVVAEYFHATSTTATSTFQGGLSFTNGTFQHYASGVTSIENLETGTLNFEQNAGWVTWVDLPVSTTTTAGTPEAFSASINGNSLLTVYAEASGNSTAISKARVVIGTSTSAVLTSTNIPYGSLLVSDGALCVDDGAGNTCASSARTRGFVYAEGSSVAGLDLAELYPSTDATLEAGEILMLDPSNAVNVKRYNGSASTTKPFGVISTDPGVLLGGFSDNSLAKAVPVALSGRVPVKVNLEGGNIEIGDLIAPSSVAGEGKKATESGYVIGTAIEAFPNASSTDSVLVFVDTRYVFIDTQFYVDAATGNVGVGVGSPLYKLHVGGDAAATGFVNVSTREAKKDISYLSTTTKASVLDRIKNIGIATYHYNDEGANAPLRLGLIAEEAPQEVLSADGKGVDLYKLSTFILTGVQEQAKRFDDLAIRLDNIESRLTAAENALATLGATTTASTTGSNNASTTPIATTTATTTIVIATTTDGFASSTVEVVLGWLKSVGGEIKDGVVRFVALVVDTLTAKSLTVGDEENLAASGITIFDRSTGEPVCMFVEDGVMKSEAGECGKVASNDPAPANDDGNASTTPNTAPDANGDSNSVFMNGSILINVLSNDSDADGDDISVQGVSTPASGTAIVEGGSIRYTPNQDFIGTDTFNYSITDGETTDSATVTITVEELPDPENPGGDTTGTTTPPTDDSGDQTGTGDQTGADGAGDQGGDTDPPAGDPPAGDPPANPEPPAGSGEGGAVATP